MSSMSAATDWSQLLEDLLCLIAKRLVTLSNLLNFGAVCRPWRRVAVVLVEQSFARCSLPSLMVSHGMSNPPAYCLYCPFTNQGLQEIHLQNENVSCVYGSRDGWVLEVRGLVENGNDYRNVNLFNPLRQRQIHMPPLPSSYCFDLGKFALSHERRRCEDLVVMAITLDGLRVCLARPGYKSWVEAPWKEMPLRDIMYHKEQFYGVTDNGRLVAWKENKDQGGLNVSFIVGQPGWQYPLSLRHYRGNFFYQLHRMLLVESSKGELLLVSDYRALSPRDDGVWWWNRAAREPAHHETYWFTVFKLEHSSWFGVENLGEDALFISKHGYHAVCATASSTIKQNCIYFPCKYTGNGVCVYNMEKEKIVECYNSHRLPPTLDADNFYWVRDHKI